MKTKKDLEVGKKYRGYGLLNEYGEFEFIPEQTGIRSGKMKVVKEDDGFKVATTVNTIQIQIGLPKSELQKGKLVFLQTFLKKVNQVIGVLREYEF